MRILVKAYKNILDAYDISAGAVDKSKIKPFLLLIEEINRAHTAAVFGEVFQLLDRNDDGISEYEIHPSEEIKEYLCEALGGTIDDYPSIKLPDNMYIWATMNSADQGVFPMDTAFKRRWSFKYIGVDDEEFHVDENQTTKVKTARENQGGTFKVAGDNIEWNVLRRAINARLSNTIIKAHEDKLMGPFFLKTMDSTGSLLINDDEFISTDIHIFVKSLRLVEWLYLEKIFFQRTISYRWMSAMQLRVKLRNDQRRINKCQLLQRMLGRTGITLSMICKPFSRLILTTTRQSKMLINI